MFSDLKLLISESIESIIYIDEYRCDKCKSTSRAKIVHEIVNLPLYLIIHVNRAIGVTSGVMRSKINAPEIICLGKGQIEYTINSVIVFFLVFLLIKIRIMLAGKTLAIVMLL